MSLSEGQMHDYKGAAPMLNAPPPARSLIGDKGHNSDPLPPGSVRSRHRAPQAVTPWSQVAHSA
jgi:hypothetical protein